jgi:putative ATPase
MFGIKKIIGLFGMSIHPASRNLNIFAPRVVDFSPALLYPDTAMPDQEKDLFSSVYDPSREPLAARMRPRTLDEFVGQDHILGPGRLLRRAIQADRISSIIFSGPPGTGKTTLARVVANSTASNFLSLNAVLSGVKDVREAVEEAKRNRELYDRRTILFVDEVHRWNKAQQDALLPWVENGTVILIGATTENPFFEVNSALVSRSRVFQLKPLNSDDLRVIARRTLEDPIRGYGKYRVTLTAEALEHLVEVADGDARSLLSALELAVETTPSRFPPPPEEEVLIDLGAAEESIQRRAVLYDKEGDYHYDTISAFIKSLRGSDPDAALYWMARMITAGEAPHFIFRRMVILASEDVGLADPMALVVVEAAARAFDRVGLPEGQYHLSQAALYLATCPKSNSAMGYFDALASVEKEGIRDVPSHLKDTNRDKKGFGHGEGYAYPHAYRDHWIAQNYLPAELRGRVFYSPGGIGYEARIREEVLRRREAQLEAVLEAPEEVLTFSPEDAGRDEWLKRTGSERTRVLEAVRDRIFGIADLKRHHRVLAADSGSGLLVWEALRRTPEGGVWAALPGKADFDLVSAYLEHLPEIDRPVLLNSGVFELLRGTGDSGRKGSGGKEGPPSDAGEAGAKIGAPPAASAAGLPPFDAILGRNLLTRVTDRAGALRLLASRLAPGGRAVLAETVPSLGSRLFETAGTEDLPGPLAAKIREAEERLYGWDRAGSRGRKGGAGGGTLAWGEAELREALAESGLADGEVSVETFEENRLVTERNVALWFGPLYPKGTEAAAEGASGPYGTLLDGILDTAEQEELKKWISRRIAGKTLPWKTVTAFLSGKTRA